MCVSNHTVQMRVTLRDKDLFIEKKISRTETNKKSNYDGLVGKCVGYSLLVKVKRVPEGYVP